MSFKFSYILFANLKLTVNCYFRLKATVTIDIIIMKTVTTQQTQYKKEKLDTYTVSQNPSLTAKKTTMMVLTVIYIKSHSCCLPTYMVFKIWCWFHHLQQWEKKALEVLHIFASWYFQLVCYVFWRLCE